MISPLMQILLLGLVTLVLMVAAVWIGIRVAKGSPDKRERKRRLLVNLHGRLGEAMITEASDTALYYTYSVGGVQYVASQDIAVLRDRLPAEPERLIGNATLKYAPKNPANSILLCEEWSGLRPPRAWLRQEAAGD
jgi:hypothetical protein